MVNYYKLIDAIDTPTNINVAKKQNGIVKYGHVQLYPGKKYELGDDEVFIKALEGAKVEKRYSETLASRLKDCNIPYKEKICKSCGGRVKKLVYNIVEVVR